MPQTRSARQYIAEALALARSSRPQEALFLLDEGLTAAREEDRSRDVALLARNAGIISSHLGDLEGAVRHYRLAREHDPDDLYVHLALADVLERLGRTADARRLVAECRDQALAANDEDVLAILRHRQPSSAAAPT